PRLGRPHRSTRRLRLEPLGLPDRRFREPNRRLRGAALDGNHHEARRHRIHDLPSPPGPRRTRLVSLEPYLERLPHPPRHPRPPLEEGEDQLLRLPTNRGALSTSQEFTGRRGDGEFFGFPFGPLGEVETPKKPSAMTLLVPSPPPRLPVQISPA